MIRPRNTLVVLRLIENHEKQIGKIHIPSANDSYTEAEVMAVGPGMTGMNAGLTETHDLKPGQRVLVKHKAMERGPAGASLNIQGIRYVSNGEVFYVFEQGSIVGIIAEPGEAPPSEPDIAGLPRKAMAIAN